MSVKTSEQSFDALEVCSKLLVTALGCRQGWNFHIIDALDKKLSFNLHFQFHKKTSFGKNHHPHCRPRFSSVSCERSLWDNFSVVGQVFHLLTIMCKWRIISAYSEAGSIFCSTKSLTKIVHLRLSRFKGIFFTSVWSVGATLRHDIRSVTRKPMKNTVGDLEKTSECIQRNFFVCWPFIASPFLKWYSFFFII